jgi:hypothetical protein
MAALTRGEREETITIDTNGQDNGQYDYYHWWDVPERYWAEQGEPQLSVLRQGTMFCRMNCHFEFVWSQINVAILQCIMA